MRVKFFMSVGLALLSAGCTASPFVSVTGCITLDGQPVKDAYVTFTPSVESAATIAYGKTNAEGIYELSLTDAQKGLLPGKFRAEISTADVTYDPVTNAPVAIPERIPAKYNRQTTLTDLVVPPGKPSKFDFKLESGGKSGGKIRQPSARSL